MTDASYVAHCRARLDRHGALVLAGFFRQQVVARITAEFAPKEAEAYYAARTHNVSLTPTRDDLDASHPFNRQVASSKGLIADDQIADTSPLREIYDDAVFRTFLSGVLGLEAIHPYADRVSSINVHFAAEGMELGWHFDNSSFAITMLLQAPTGGGRFEYVAGVLDPNDDAATYDRVEAVLDGTEPSNTLEFEPGDLVLFRGRHSMHRVTPTEGRVTRMLVVFAFNDQPGVVLSDSALATFYGRGG